MATTKVIKDLLASDSGWSTSSESGLKMPSSNAAYSGPTAAEGMMRNQVGQVSESSASTMQHYNGTDWKNFVNKALPPATFATHYLVVAGGAGGGSQCGGGGAGGLLSTTTYGGSGSALDLLLSTAYTITVGAGGAGLSYPAGYQLVGPPGSPSTISGSFTGSPITSAGGGGGASNNVVGADGGSGGGGGTAQFAANAPGTATPAGQGFNGGAGLSVGGNPYTGGGGGGAGAAGVASTSVGGAGGAGKVINIIGSNFTYAGGGGGGGGTQGGAGGAGGTGGGGAGATGAGGIGQGATVPNSGSGGGSSGDAGPTGAGAAGVIILRYPSASVASFVITGTLNTPTPATVGTDKVITFTTGTGTITFS